jgi:hypothetical protein
MHHLGKIPNMACQGFTGGLFHNEVLPGRKNIKNGKTLHFPFFQWSEGSKQVCGSFK